MPVTDEIARAALGAGDAGDLRHGPFSEAQLEGARERLVAQGLIKDRPSTPPPSQDKVTLPKHYGQFAIEPIRFGVENYGPGVLIVKIVKYIMRYVMKNGHEDLAKAHRCLVMLRRYEAGDVDWWMRTERGESLPDSPDAPLRSHPQEDAHG